MYRLQLFATSIMKILRSIFYSLPPTFRFWVRRIVFLPVDIWEGLIGKRPVGVPPRGLIYTGSGDFVAQGNKFRDYFVQLGGLKPHHHVLDVGSGIGRMAFPLTQFLSKEGRYEGFDVVEYGVKWCQQHISKQHPNFHFQYVALENDLYTADGNDASKFRFPYADATFDFVFLTSVFTHLLPDITENYCKEIARVLKPGGICFGTFFILTPESIAAMEQTRTFYFPYQYANYAVMNQQVPSANVAYKIEYLHQQLLAPHHLHLKYHHLGSWSGLPESIDFQDILIIEKNS